VRAAVALAVAAALFVAAAALYRHRGATLRFMTRLRGFDRTPVGPRRRYQTGWTGQIDMALPVLVCLVLGLAFLVRGILTLQAP
jgi:hypothetical protein